MGERNLGFLEESFPADPFRPIAKALIFAGVFRVHINDVLDRIDRAGPTRGLIGDERNDDLGELRLADPVGELAAHQDGDSTANFVGKRHGCAHGVAVSAEHAAFSIDFKALQAGCLSWPA